MAQGFYGGYMGNAGALSDLVYRGNPGQMMPMPYYGGGMNIQQLGGFVGPGQLSTDVIQANIPGASLSAGGVSFPIRPEDSDAKEEAQFKERFSQPGSWRQYIRDYQHRNPLQREIPSAGVGNVGGLFAQSTPLMGIGGKTVS